MDDGKELIEMVCTSYESPIDVPEDDQHDFSESRHVLCQQQQSCTCSSIADCKGSCPLYLKQLGLLSLVLLLLLLQLLMLVISNNCPAATALPYMGSWLLCMWHILARC